MDRELRRLTFEIIALILMLIIVVPVCANASSEYQKQKDILLKGVGTSVDITNNGDMKKVTIYSKYDDTIKVNLFLKINKFSDDYKIYLNGEIYDINVFSCTEDMEYRYYQLGIFEVNKYRSFDFKLMVNDSKYYDESIVYSFVTEGLF